MNRQSLSPEQAVAHLEGAAFRAVNRTLVAKAIAEFSHELLLSPELENREAGSGSYRLRSDDGQVEYAFRARSLELDHLLIDESSLERRVAGALAPLDAMSFIVEFRQRLVLPDAKLPGYLEELAATVYGAAFKLEREGHEAPRLAQADFQVVEAAMSEGHPCFVANNGRIGFDANDYRAYAPEAGASLQLVWLAALRSRTEFATVRGLSYQSLIASELDEQARREFAQKLSARGLHAESYYYLPVHPWQWENKLAQLFAADLASDSLVHLGAGRDRYRPQQSIRTLFNDSWPEKRYVKTALSIRNMGFSRGISARICESSAAVNDFANDLVSGDVYLQQLGFEVLREVAFIGFRQRYFERANDKRSDGYKEMLAALWRDSPVARLRPRERLMTMAALFYVDREGRSLLFELIQASRVGIDAWLRAYLAAYLKPQLHCFYAHRLVFTPHAENLILVLEDDVVTRVIIKDIAEDIGVLNPEAEPPFEVRRLALRVPEDVMTLSIFTDVFDCLFRFLAALLEKHAAYPQRKFWRQVGDCVHDYQRSQPQFADRFRRYDLFAPTFLRNCLNRLQLTDHESMIDLNAAEPVESLQFHGVLANPIAPFAHGREANR